MVVDRGHDWPSYVQKDLETYGAGMWMFRNQPESKTARALNSYMGEHRRCVASPLLPSSPLAQTLGVALIISLREYGFHPGISRRHG